MEIIIDYGISPNMADVAFTSTNSLGTPGYLNKYVLEELGYHLKDIPDSDTLKPGFNLIQRQFKKPIIFIVTIDAHELVTESFEKNLAKGIQLFQQKFRRNSVWFPLMGTGLGGLDLDDSFEITMRAIARYRTQFSSSKVYISVPKEVNEYQLNEYRKYADDILKPTEKLKEPIKFISDEQIRHTEQLSKQVQIAAAIDAPRRNFWWINASKRHFRKLPIKLGDVYDYPIINKNGDRKPRFSQLKEGDFLVGYDTQGERTIYGCFVLVSVTVDFASIKLIYSFENPLHWSFIKELTLFSRSVIVSSKVSSPLNSLAIGQFNELIFEAVTDLDKFLKALKSPDLLNFDISKLNRIDSAVLDDKNEVDEESNSGQEEILTTEPEETITKNIARVASVIDDTPDGEDYLDITEDVDAFAKVIALNELPTPLSIALFGDWGSGKSFFMNRLEKRIKLIVEKQPKKSSVFARNIIHIRFNAWAYLDANLHASLASIIFEKIFDHLNGSNSKEEVIKKEYQKIIDQLSFVQNEKQEINTEITIQKENKEKIESEIHVKTQELQSLLREEKKLSAKNIFSNVLEELSVKEKIKEALQSSHINKVIDVTEHAVKDLSTLFSEVNKLKYSFTNIFTWQFGIILFIIGLLLVGGIGYASSHHLFDDLNNTLLIIPQIVLGITTFLIPVIMKISWLANRINPVLKKINSIKLEVDQSFKLKLDELDHSIIENKEKLISCEIQISELKRKDEQATRNIETLQLKLNQNLSAEGFKTTINSIHSSKTYKKQLGIVSQLREDFQLLSDLFVDQKKDKNSTKNVDRIVLYIDDLDRCSEEHVLSVIEAVHLLLAYKLFVVVVGVDHRWVKNALITKHHKLFGIKQKIPGYEPIEPNTYLEKIFQVPFHVKSASDKSVQKMISKLLGPNEVQNPNSDLNQDQNSSMKEQLENREPIKRTEDVVMGGSTKSISIIPKREHRSSASISESDQENKTNTIEELLILSDDEKKLLPQFQFLLGNNPRSIKRYVNIYRIVRSHGELPGGANQTENNLICMFLVALSIGTYKSTFNKMHQLWNTQFYVFTILSNYFTIDNAQPEIAFNLEKNESLKTLLEMQEKKFHKVANFVYRFSFKHMEVLNEGVQN